MASLKCPLCKRSTIGHLLKQDTMMRSILRKFVECMHMHMDDVIDRLISQEVLQTKHHELLTVHRERGQLARRIWDLLLRLPHRKFEEHVIPLLEELGFLEEQDATPTLRACMCLRCAMEHFLPLDELADALVSMGVLKAAEYRDTVKSSLLELTKWKMLFTCLKREHQNQEVVSIVEQFLREYEIPVPRGMRNILGGGTTCACNSMDAPIEEHAELRRSLPATENLCRRCQGMTRRTRGCRSPIPESAASETHLADLFPPMDVVDGCEPVDMRDRSCRNLRRNRMGLAQRFQRDLMKPANVIVG